MALLCQRAENTFIGVNCGIMDQFAIALGEEDTALFLDTRNLDYKNIRLRLGSHRIVVSNTNKPRTLADSAYNERRSQCETAVAVIRKTNPETKSLRDVDMAKLLENRSAMKETVFNRARHVIEENDRVIQSIQSLENNDLHEFGQLMNRSHESLRDHYEVSCTELDIMVEEAQKISGVIGSRMTGAGFGGCTVSIVTDDAVPLFIEQVGENYRKRTGIPPTFYPTRSVNGVEITNQPDA
jgi:galactokinase